jgi:hypothetical protein
MWTIRMVGTTGGYADEELGKGGRPQNVADVGGTPAQGCSRDRSVAAQQYLQAAQPALPRPV